MKRSNAKETKLPAKKKSNFDAALMVRHFKRDWQLHLLILLPVIYGAIFWYWPMYGVQIAFREYRPKLGITGSEWVGLQWFIQFLTNYQFTEVLINTLTISLYSIVVGFPLPIIFALFLNSIESKRFKRFTQTISYIPHFLSTTVLVAIIDMVFSATSGVYGTLYKTIMDVSIAPDFKSLASTFPHLYVWTGIWQEIGWDSIIYMAALGSVSQELHEAAMIDGCTRWQTFCKITLPLCKPMIVYQVITAFMGPWMDFIFAKIIVRVEIQYATVSIGMWKMLEMEYIGGWFTRFCAAAVLVSIPIAILFMITQKFYQEAMGGAVKG